MRAGQRRHCCGADTHLHLRCTGAHLRCTRHTCGAHTALAPLRGRLRDGSDASRRVRPLEGRYLPPISPPNLPQSPQVSPEISALEGPEASRHGRRHWLVRSARQLRLMTLTGVRHGQRHGPLRERQGRDHRRVPPGAVPHRPRGLNPRWVRDSGGMARAGTSSSCSAPCGTGTSSSATAATRRASSSS